MINNANRERNINFSEIICNSLNGSSDLKEALTSGLKQEEKKSSVLFTVITKSDERDKTKSDFFITTGNDQIIDTNEVNNS